MSKFSEAVLRLLADIPRCKVTTYGELAKAAGTSPRAVGQAMRGNSRPDLYPCYKVVHSDGRLGGYSGPGGVRTKVRLLRRDGIEVRGGKVDLDRFLHRLL